MMWKILTGLGVAVGLAVPCEISVADEPLMPPPPAMYGGAPGEAAAPAGTPAPRPEMEHPEAPGVAEHGSSQAKIYPGSPTMEDPGYYGAPGYPGASGYAPGAMPPSMTGTAPGMTPMGAAGAAPRTAPGLGGALGGAASFHPMFGDFLQFSAGRQFGAQQLPGTPGTPGTPPTGVPTDAGRINSRARVFKIADNQIPRPVDRLFFTFNHFEDVNDAINRRLQSNVFNIQVQRYVLGFEKTFLEGRAALGLRQPLNVVHADHVTNVPELFDLTRSQTALGDLFVYSKFILHENTENDFLLSGGLALTIPSGPNRFAGASFIENPHSFAAQPYWSFFKSYGRLFFIGFQSLDVPFNIGDATILFNDLGVGYLVYQNNAPNALLTAVAPAFEVHANIPLSHRNPFDPFDEAGTPDIVNLTYGISFTFRQRATFSAAMVTPVTGPRPFDFEVLALLNILF
ncbi:hypothetical protein BH23PLA1_BH23PLA1_00180 [soil metagenome]